MSFGYSVGDCVLLTQLAWRVVQNSRKACGAHSELTSEVLSLHIVLRRLEIETSKPGSILTRSDDSLDKNKELAQLLEDCRGVLKVLDEILQKYNALSEEKRSATKLWKKVKFGNGEMLDLADIRLKISTSTSALTLFLNLLSMGSQGKVERYMESQGDELREMRRSLNWITASMQAKAPKAGEGSILTTYSGDDKKVWKDFRRELIKEGFSSDVLHRHKETIKDYIMELGSRGALDDITSSIDQENMPFPAVGESSETRFPAEEDYSKGDSEVSDVSSEDGSRDGSRPGTEEKPAGEPAPEATEDSRQLSAEYRILDERVKSSDENQASNDLELRRNDNEPNITGQQPPRNGSYTASKQSDLLAGSINISTTSQHDSDDNEELQANTVISLSQTSQLLVQQRPPQLINDTSNVSQPELETAHHQAGAPKELISILPKLFGPYYRLSKCEELWGLLQFKTDGLQNPTYYYGSSYGNLGPPHTPHYLCNWIWGLAPIYDQSHTSANSSPGHQDLLLPLADEFCSLFIRVCVCSARIHLAGHGTRAVTQFHNRFHILNEAFYDIVRDGICYMLAVNKEEIKSKPSKKLWRFHDGISWDEETDEFLTNQAAQGDGRTTRSIYELDAQACNEMVYGLFGDEDILHSRNAFVRKSPLANLVPKVQELLLFFMRHCEEPLLHDESEKLDYGFRMEDTTIITPRGGFGTFLLEPWRYELAISQKAMEVWSLENTYHNDIIKIRPFSKSTSSLGEILARCDDVQFKIFAARKMFFAENFLELKMEVNNDQKGP